ncbi:peptidylprolyl isomerase [Phaeospirillum tilakii]|uniref:Parvulin-like PPIase n=1 Tax=Phaeospirillum tilakii TaxID=741673 RepID=A0ABW5C8E6_9PROT
MLDVFRRFSKTWVVRILFALLALSFVVWGVGDVVRGGASRGPAIEVGRTAVTAPEVLNEFKREIERLQPLFGGKLTAEEARKLGILDRTVDTVITRSLIDEAARGLGLVAVDEVILRRITANPAFHGPGGQFDRELFRSRLARAGLSEDSFLRIERGNMVRNQLADALTGGLAAPAALADPLLRWRGERRTADTLQLDDASVPLPAAPDAATLEAYYKANTERFIAPESRALTVLLLRPADVAAGIAIDEAMLRDSFQQRQEEFSTPERRQVAQIVIDGQSDVARAYELLGQGKDLAAVAKALGRDIIDLGWVERRDLPEGLSDAVFRLGAGATGQPVKTALGWHVVRVAAIQPGKVQSFNDVRARLEQDLRREKALDALAEMSNKLEDALGGGATLEEAAGRFNLKVTKIPAVDAQGRGANGKPVPDLPKSDQFLDVAFHTEPNTESPLTEVPDNGYFLVRVDQVTPPAPRPLAEIKAEVTARWQAERRHEQARAKADKLVERLKAGESLATVAQSAGLRPSRTKPFQRQGGEGVALPPPVIAGLFAAKPGEVVSGDLPGATLIARVAEVLPFDPQAAKPAAESERRRIAQNLANDVADQFIAALNAAIGVKVDRQQLSNEE